MPSATSRLTRTWQRLRSSPAASGSALTGTSRVSPNSTGAHPSLFARRWAGRAQFAGGSHECASAGGMWGRRRAGSQPSARKRLRVVVVVVVAAAVGRLLCVLRIDETWHRLREWTAGSAVSERLAAQILLAERFTGVDPAHPLGAPDGGRDGLAR